MKTKEKTFDFTIGKKTVTTKVVPKRSAQDLEHSKELRALLKTLGSLAGIPRESPNRNVLDVNYARREVYFGNSVVGEFISGGSAEHVQFEIHEDLIDIEATELKHSFTGAQVKAEYGKALQAMSSRS